MASNSRIEWTERTWNPITGCDRISPGCDHCYAKTMARRLKGMSATKYQTDGDPRTSGPGFGVAVHPDALGEPLSWRKPSRVFVCSMADLFHARVPQDAISKVWKTMAATPQHTYQVLTKRPERMYAATSLWDDPRCPLPNVMLGTTVETRDYVDRIEYLRATPAVTRFLSLEPLLGPLPDLDLYGINWVIVGGESGQGARRMDPDWVRDIIAQCQAAEVPVFVKQMGSRFGGSGKGGDMSLWPIDLRVREYPQRLAGVAAA